MDRAHGHTMEVSQSERKSVPSKVPRSMTSQSLISRYLASHSPLLSINLY